jgi:hypothetical protein
MHHAVAAINARDGIAGDQGNAVLRVPFAAVDDDLLYRLVTRQQRGSRRCATLRLLSIQQ